MPLAKGMGLLKCWEEVMLNSVPSVPGYREEVLVGLEEASEELEGGQRCEL